jgi:tetratricopeptide (TPR) repeat protein
LGGLSERVEALYQLPPDAAERAGAELLKEVIGNRTLLLLMENLDDVFAGLGDEGQKRLRAFLQENTCCTILATSQSLFNGVKLQTSPFYGFFRIHHLEDLTSEDATQLLANIARLEGDRELESFIQMPTGRDRIRAVHHLAGGSHRVYVIFSEFLTRESLDELVEPFMRMLDDLTPYYQARMQWLSPQQRKIIEFLCDRRHPVPVKEIAQRCFMTHQTASGQLKKLLEMGYVRSYPEGRESFYELREVLMRFCLEVKKQRGETIQLFVDFLRLWYTRKELQQRLQMVKDDAPLERKYLLHALQMAKEESEDPRVAAYREELDAYLNKNDFIHALPLAEKLVAICGDAQDWLNRGYCLCCLRSWDEALASLDKVIELNPNYAIAWANRGAVLLGLERYEEALESCDKAIELNPNEAGAWYSRGGALLPNPERHSEALASLNKAIELNPNDANAWYDRGRLLSKFERYSEALVSFNKVTQLEPNDAMAWYERGSVLSQLEQYEEALASFDKAIELEPNYASAWCDRGAVLFVLRRFNEALACCNKAVELNPNKASYWGNRGTLLLMFKRYDEALASLEKVIEIDSNDAWAWVSQGVALGNLGRHDQALASCDRAIELGEQDSSVFFNRAEFLLALNRWDEGSAALDDALSRFSHADEPDKGDTAAIIRNLFNSTYDGAIWRSRITTLIELYDKHQVISALGQGLVRSIPALMSEMVSDKAAQTWLEVWQELTSDYSEFQIPLRLLNAAVRYRETKGDKRVLLELPIEERNLLKPLLGISEGGQ